MSLEEDAPSEEREPDGTVTTVVAGLEKPESCAGEDAGCLVQIFGDGLGRRIELSDGDWTVGRGDDCEIVLVLDAVSRDHCAVRVAGGRVTVRDLESTNGTFVCDQRLLPNEAVELTCGDHVQVGSAIFKFLQGGNVEALYHDEIYRSSVIDALTHLYNRRYLFDHLRRELARAHRHGRSLSLVLLDIDRFKSINDEHGHLAGDSVLRDLGELIRSNVRREDCCARYGGEEFAIAAAENDIHSTFLMAEKLRGVVEAREFVFEGTVIPVTISLGVATLTPDMAEVADLIGAADARLYEAKRSGRNCVAM